MDSKARASPADLPDDLYERSMAVYGDPAQAARVVNDIIDYREYLIRRGAAEAAARFVERSLSDLAIALKARHSVPAKVLRFAATEGRNLTVGAFALIVGSIVMAHFGIH